MDTQKISLVLSALGEDHPGIMNKLSKMILDHGCSIEDSRMTVLGGDFAAILLVKGKWNKIAKIESSLPELGRQLDLKIHHKRTAKREKSDNRIPYMIDVVAMDHPGVLNQLTEFFAQRQINIENLTTNVYEAPHTGTSMFSVHMVVGIPALISISLIRDEFIEYCDELNLDVMVEPLKNNQWN
jgi:glycine cleavage system transcriptional repressor